MAAEAADQGQRDRVRVPAAQLAAAHAQRRRLGLPPPPPHRRRPAGRRRRRGGPGRTLLAGVQKQLPAARVRERVCEP